MSFLKEAQLEELKEIASFLRDKIRFCFHIKQNKPVCKISVRSSDVGKLRYLFERLGGSLTFSGRAVKPIGNWALNGKVSKYLVERLLPFFEFDNDLLDLAETWLEGTKTYGRLNLLRVQAIFLNKFGEVKNSRAYKKQSMACYMDLWREKIDYLLQ